MFRANDQISLQILDCCQWVEDNENLSCLGLAAGKGPLGQDTEDVTDIAFIVMSPPGTLVDNVDIHGDETVAVSV